MRLCWCSTLWELCFPSRLQQPKQSHYHRCRLLLKRDIQTTCVNNSYVQLIFRSVIFLFAFSASANFISLFFPMLSASWHMFVFTRTIICVLYNKSQVSRCTHQRPFQMTLLLMYLLCCSLLQNPLYYLRNNDITLKDVFKIRVLSKHNLLSVEFLFNVSSIAFPPSSPILLLC